MKKNIILIVVVMLMGAPAYAHLYNNDFEAHTAGVSVNSETHESWNWYTPGAAAVFADDGGNTVMDLVGGQTHLNIGGYNSPIDEVLESHLNYEFDIKISNFDRWDIYFSDNATSDVIAPSFNKGALESHVSYKVDGVQTNVAVPGFVVGQWAHASIQLNQAAETWSMNLAGTQIVTDGLLANTTGNGGNWAVSTERLIFEVPGSVLIDNIVVTEIPEPATMCLLGFGGLLLRRKRKQTFNQK